MQTRNFLIGPGGRLFAFLVFCLMTTGSVLAAPPCIHIECNGGPLVFVCMVEIEDPTPGIELDYTYSWTGAGANIQRPFALSTLVSCTGETPFAGLDVDATNIFTGEVASARKFIACNDGQDTNPQ